MQPHGPVIELAFSGLQPSQLYVSAERLVGVCETARASGFGALGPVPFSELDGETILTDGHTRALVVYRAGLTTVRAVRDTDDLDRDAYRECVRWCREEGVFTVADLDGRVVTAEEFERLWLERCRRMHRELAALRRGGGGRPLRA